MTKKLPVVLLALAFAAAACGGGPDAKSAEKPSRSKPTTASPTANPSNRADQAIADGSVLTLADFPAGWEAKKSDGDKDEAENRRIAECTAVSYDELYGGTSGDADSKDFTSSDDDTISNSVTVSPDEATTIKAFEISSGDKFLSCVEDELQKYLEKEAAKEDDITVGDATVNQMSFDQFGDQTLAFKVTIPMKSQGIGIDVIGEFVHVRVGRASSLITAQSSVTPFDLDELTKLVRVSTDRLSAKLNG